MDYLKNSSLNIDTLYEKISVLFTNIRIHHLSNSFKINKYIHK